MKEEQFPEFDSLRALAAGAVMIAHFGLLGGAPVLPHVGERFGAVGVDLFFALSGFLITGILFRCRSLLPAQRRVLTLKRFYIRRTLRIFPLYYFVVLLFALLGVDGIREHLPWFLSYMVNFGKTLSQDGWYPLNHFWTLAVEEQFYLTWPLLVLVLSPKALVRTCFSAATFSLLLRLYLGTQDASVTALTQLTPCCLEPLALGSAFAILRATGGRGVETLSKICLVAGGLGSLLITAWAPDPLLNVLSRTIYGITFAGLVVRVAALTGQAVLSPLRLAPLLYLGRISYGLYVWHFPVVWLTNGNPVHLPPEASPILNRALDFSALFALTVLASVLSWTLLERPLNALKRHFPYQV